MKNKLKYPYHNTTHGMSYTRFHEIWRSMKSRCYRKNDASFKFYGKKGIKCKWENFEDFRDDLYQSYLEHCKEFGEKNTTLERFDNSKDYSKENCRWATPREQANNRSNNKFITYKNKTKTLSMWARELGIEKSTLNCRLKAGWEVKEAFFKPVRPALTDLKSKIVNLIP